MTRPWKRLIPLCLALSACGRHGAEQARERSLNLASYSDPAGRFSCRAPGDWRVQEDPEAPPSTIFFGPSAGSDPYSASIAVRFYAKTEPESQSPEDYAAARASLDPRGAPVRRIAWKGRMILEYAAVRNEWPVHEAGKPAGVLEHAYLIPFKDGFLAVVHSAPADSAERTAPVFQALLDTLEFQERRARSPRS